MYHQLIQSEEAILVPRSEEVKNTATSDSIPPVLSFWANVVTIVICIGAFGFYAYSYFKFFKKFNKEYYLAKQMNHHSNTAEQSKTDETKNASTLNVVDTIVDTELSNQAALGLNESKNLDIIPKLNLSYGDKLKNFFLFKTALIEEKMGINLSQQLEGKEKSDKKVPSEVYNEADKQVLNSNLNVFMIKNLKDKNDKLQSIDSVLLPPEYSFIDFYNADVYSQYQ